MTDAAPLPGLGPLLGRIRALVQAALLHQLDHGDPAQALAERGALNALVFECLAERTIALAQLRRRADPEAGFDPMLVARMRAVLPLTSTVSPCGTWPPLPSSS